MGILLNWTSEQSFNERWKWVGVLARFASFSIINDFIGVNAEIVVKRLVIILLLYIYTPNANFTFIHNIIVSSGMHIGWNTTWIRICGNRRVQNDNYTTVMLYFLKEGNTKCIKSALKWKWRRLKNKGFWYRVGPYRKILNHAIAK